MTDRSRPVSADDDPNRVNWSKHRLAPATCPNCGETFQGHNAYLAHWRTAHDAKQGAASQ